MIFDTIGAVTAAIILPWRLGETSANEPVLDPQSGVTELAGSGQ